MNLRLEALWNTDLSQLEGEPYIDVEWKSRFYKEADYLNLKLTYRWKGYQILPHQKGYSKEDEFAALELEQDDDGYFYVSGVGVAEPFRREGYARVLYQKALGLIKNKGFKGIRSYKVNRTSDADAFWKTQGVRSDADSDYLENFKSWLKNNEKRT